MSSSTSTTAKGFTSHQTYNGDNLHVNSIKKLGKAYAAEISYGGAKKMYIEMPEAISTTGYKVPQNENASKYKKQIDLVIGDDRPDNNGEVKKDSQVYEKTREMFKNIRDDLKTRIIEYMKQNSSNETVSELLKKIGRLKDGPKDDDERIFVPHIVKHPDIDNENGDVGPFRINAKNRVSTDESGYPTDETAGKNQVIKCIDEENGKTHFDIDKEGPNLGRGTWLKCHLQINLAWLIAGDKKELNVYPDIQLSRIAIKKRATGGNPLDSMEPPSSELDEDDELIHKELQNTSSPEEENVVGDVPVSRTDDDDDEPDKGEKDDDDEPDTGKNEDEDEQGENDDDEQEKDVKEEEEEDVKPAPKKSGTKTTAAKSSTSKKK